MVREYQRVTDETRSRLIKLIRDGQSIKDAAALVNINYENAKAINRIYRRETRVEKKKSRYRYRQDEDRDAARAQRLAF